MAPSRIASCARSLVEHRLGQRLAGGVPAAGAEVVLGRRDLRAGSPVDRLEHLEALRDDLRADAVAADDGDVEGLRVAVVGHGVQPRDAVSGCGRPSQPWMARDGRGRRRARGLTVAQSSEWPWSRRSIDSCRAWRARVASSRVLFSFIGGLAFRGPAGRSMVWVGSVLEPSGRAGEPVSDVAGSPRRGS